MIHNSIIKGNKVQTGDLICTTDGGEGITGKFWFLIGKIIPGEVDHIVVYIGPGTKCIEAGPNGVIAFDADPNWNGAEMADTRGFIDSFYGIANPASKADLDKEMEESIREKVANYCIEQANLKKPYNIFFPNSDTENSFYCSHLAYKAYLPHGIDLNTDKDVPNVPFTSSIIFPQEIWSSYGIK